MLIGYNTNGFAHHRLEDAIEILADIGYRSVAITVDYHALNPYDPDLDGQIRRVNDLLERLEMSCVVETGARFLLDRMRKHYPTLLNAAETERSIRRDFLRRCIEIAGELGASAVSLWSGSRPPGSECSDDDLLRLLADELRPLCDVAGSHDVKLAFEPEPGMFIDTMAQFERLDTLVDHAAFGLTLDVGHVHCLNDGRPQDQIARWADKLFNIHIEDMRRGVHDHLMFGEGEMEILPILQALESVDYRGGVHVELSRHSHDAVRVAGRAMDYLKQRLHA